MSGPDRAAEASAPCSLDLGGGAAGGAAVAVALDRRVACRAEKASGVRLASRDTLQRVEGPSAAALATGEGPLALAARALAGMGVDSGVALVTHVRLPPGAGLGEDAALAVAVVAAAARLLGRDLAPEEAARVALDLEPGDRRHAAAVHAAVRGGLVAVGAEGVPEPLAVDPARVEECLVLVDAGEEPPAAVVGPSDGGEAVRAALLEGRYEDVREIWRGEWRHGHEGRTAVRAASALLAAGAGIRSVGGSGRLLAAWAPPGARGEGPRETVLRAAKEAGLRLFPARVDLLGLDVEPRWGSATIGGLAR